MKYALIFLAALSFTASAAYSQILNGGFEDWSGNIPNHWFVDDKGVIVSRDTNSRAGRYSAHFEESSNDLNVFLSNNSRGKNIGGSRIPLGNYYVTFWYKAQVQYPKGYIATFVGISHNGVGGESFGQPYGNESSWTKVTFPFQISTTDSMSEDSVALNFNLFPSGPFTFDIDDVNLEPIPNVVISMGENINNFIAIVPNPILSHANLHYHLDATSPIQSSIFDITGREVMKLPSLPSASGDGSIPFDCDGIPNGMYYLRFNAGGTVEMRKIIVQH